MPSCSERPTTTSIRTEEAGAMKKATPRLPPPWTIENHNEARFIVKDKARPMWSIHNDGGTSGAKETAMNTTRFERRSLPTFFMAGWVAFFGVIENAQAQPVNPVPPP